MENHPTKPLLFLLILLSSSFTLQSEACNPTDQGALLHFKKLITHDPKNLLKTWISNTDCCKSWKGISCDPQSGRVVGISLSGQLSGTLSPSLANLSSLQILDLNSNRLTGPIPETLGHLINLQLRLDLSNNQLTGTIPHSLNRLALLNYLDFSWNRLTGPIPSSIGDLAAKGPLFELKLNNNLLSGEIPRSLGNLVQLNGLYLQNNKLSGSIPKEIINLDALQSTGLDLQNNQLSGEIPPHKAKFPASSFLGNAGLCGPPLPPCKH